jgi:hypothetical protein
MLVSSLAYYSSLKVNAGYLLCIPEGKRSSIVSNNNNNNNNNNLETLSRILQYEAPMHYAVVNQLLTSTRRAPKCNVTTLLRQTIKADNSKEIR